ncbi:MAG: riboflavin biosynthesis protein RibD [Chitinophagaceae bacterium]|nr:MAG: riboflavin biosynthesis protein RibD [Chitinophagaceae bacterium]
MACRDPFSKVNGEGIRRLKAARIDVTEGILEQEAIQLNKRFFSFHQKNRPYITLKWAQTADGFIAGADSKPLAISGSVANRWVHRMRSEEAAIMVGYNTALYDNPQLTTRLWHGKNPLRIVIDKKLLLSPAAEIYNSQARTLVLNELKDSEEGAVTFIKMPDNKPLLPFLMDQLYHFKVNSLIVEGGSKLLTSFIEAGIWDEAFVIKNIQMLLHHGVSAPSIPSDLIRACTTLGADQVEHFINNK